MEKSDCDVNFPSHCQLTEFQKVLVVQALRSDRLHSALLQCVFHLTGNCNNFNFSLTCK